jgi:hypothetical protein
MTRYATMAATLALFFALGGPTAGHSELRFVEDPEAAVPACDAPSLIECPNLQSILVTTGSWLMQAKFAVTGPLAANRCGLVVGDAGAIDLAIPLTANVSLTDVLTVDGPTRVALRCKEILGDVTLSHVKLTALAVDEVVEF